MYVLQLMDTYVASYALLIIAVIELVALGWVYGKHLCVCVCMCASARP